MYLWGAGGAPESLLRRSGSGAFVSGMLAVSPGEKLRVITGVSLEVDRQGTEDEGCGGRGKGKGANGGGRSAVQRLAETSWGDVVTAGGGGGGFNDVYAAYCMIGPDAGSGRLGHPATCAMQLSSGSGGFSDGNFTTCITGARSCGAASGAQESSGGGAGFCGGLVSQTSNGFGGGGSSNPSQLHCANTVDATYEDLARTPFNAGGGAGRPGHDGLVIISTMPDGWAPCSPAL